jgi:hypothetical protein
MLVTYIFYVYDYEIVAYSLVGATTLVAAPGVPREQMIRMLGGAIDIKI